MKKWMGVSLIAMMISIPLAGCGEKTSSDGGASAAPTTHAPVTLVFQNAYNSDDEAKFMSDYGNKIKEKFPYVTIEYSPSGVGGATLKSRVTSGGDIDVLFTSVGLIKTGLLDYNLQYDISPLIAKTKYDLNRLEPTTIEMQRNFADGGIYGLPVSTVTLSLFYNKDIFDKFGVPYPKDGMTWDDVYELTKKVSRTDGASKYNGFGMSVVHMMRMNQMSLSYLDPKTNQPQFTNDKFKKLIENFTRFAAIPGNEDPNFTNLDATVKKFVKDKNLAMLAAASNTVTETQNAEAIKSLNWDMVGIPSFKDMMGVGTQSYPLFFYISTTSKHKDDAFEVISYLTSDEFQLQQAQNGVIPILKDNKKAMEVFGQNATQLKGKNVKALVPAKFASPSPYSKYNAVAEGSLLKAISTIVSGKQDINSALQTAVDGADKAVKTAQSK